MRFRSFFYILMATLWMITPASQAAKPPTVFWELKDTLQSYAQNPLLGSVVQAVQCQLMRYKKLLETAALTPNRQAYSIDIIGQYHDYISNPTANLPMVKISQDSVFKSLINGRYDVIGYEGTDVDPVNFETLWRSYMIFRTETNGALDSADVWNTIQNQIPYDGVLQYLSKHPKICIIGTEDIPLTMLHETLLSLCDKRSREAGTPLAYFAQLVSQFKSEIALAKLVMKLRNRVKSRGALVIGYLHREHLERMINFFQIRWTYIATNPAMP